jgi:hypothetical protein
MEASSNEERPRLGGAFNQSESRTGSLFSDANLKVAFISLFGAILTMNSALKLMIFQPILEISSRALFGRIHQPHLFFALHDLTSYVIS